MACRGMPCEAWLSHGEDKGETTMQEIYVKLKEKLKKFNELYQTNEYTQLAFKSLNNIHPFNL